MRGAPPPPVIRPPNAAADHQFVGEQLCLSVDLSVKLSVRYSPLVNSSLNRFIKFTTNIQIVKTYRVGNCIVLNCVEVANQIRYIPKTILVMASSRNIEVE